MATFAATAAFNATLQRKGLVGVVMVAPMSATLPADICSGGGTPVLTALTGFVTLGKLSADGISFGDTVTKQEQRGWGDIYPSRVDVSGEDCSMSFTAIETRKASIDAFYGVDQTSVTAGANGTLTFDKPPLPVTRDKRVLGLFKDSNADGTGDIYMAILFPRANISQNGDVAYAFNEAGVGYPMTAAALVDDTAGTPCRLFWGGPGLASLKTGMGYS